MMDVHKQILYWKLGAEEDLLVGSDLVDKGHIRHGLFFVHLSLEKLLKAFVCKQTRDLAPRIHNLVRLAELADLRLEEKQVDILAEMNAFHIEGRYPESLGVPPSREEAREYLRRAEEVYAWLTRQL